MGEITLHVTIRNIPDDYFMDDKYDRTHEFIVEELQELAECLEGCLYDVEIK